MTTMKQSFLLMAVASLMLVSCGCKPAMVRQPDSISCHVDPDEVFGAHYTAADFRIWHEADRDFVESVAGWAVREKGISTYFSGNHGAFANADTAVVGARMREICASHRTGDTVCVYGWCPDYDSSRSTLVVVYGAKPLIDGTAVVLSYVYVERSIDKSVVAFDFAKEYHADWLQITHDNISNYLPVTLGNRLLMIPMVNGEISGGSTSLTGLAEEECCALVTILGRKESSR